MSSVILKVDTIDFEPDEAWEHTMQPGGVTVSKKIGTTGTATINRTDCPAVEIAKSFPLNGTITASGETALVEPTP